MKRLIFLILSITCLSLNAQIEEVSGEKKDWLVHRTVMNNNFNYLDDRVDSVPIKKHDSISAHKGKFGHIEVDSISHAIGGFEDSTITITISSAGIWYHATNDIDSVAIGLSSSGFGYSNDTLVCLKKGDFWGMISVTYSGTLNNEYQFRGYNVTKDKQIGFKQGATVQGIGSYANVCFPMFASVDVGYNYVYSPYTRNLRFSGLNTDSVYTLKSLSSRNYYTNRWQIYTINGDVVDSIDAGSGNSDILTINSISPNGYGNIDITISESVNYPNNNIYLNALVLSFDCSTYYDGDTITFGTDTTLGEWVSKINGAIQYTGSNDTIILGKDTPYDWVRKQNDFILTVFPETKDTIFYLIDNFEQWSIKTNNAIKGIKP